MKDNLVENNNNFSLDFVYGNNLNKNAVAKVNQFLPELTEKTKVFDRKNSQHSLVLMSLTMLTGQSPMRMMRQILAEVEKRKLALSQAQVSYAETLAEIKELENKTDDVSLAKVRNLYVTMATSESKINGSFKDIAILIDTYNNIKDINNIDDWDEATFEKEEKLFHVRRGFELLYRNILDGNRASISSSEYLQQFGIHPQVATHEVAGYATWTEQQIAKGIYPHANDLENFLDAMAAKYVDNIKLTNMRMFGKEDFVNQDIMNLCRN